jgi:hypothetical protein
MLFVDVGYQGFELFFSTARREVGDLRLEGADQIGTGVDDGGAEFENGVIAPLADGAGNLAGSGSRPTQSRELFFCQAAASI